MPLNRIQDEPYLAINLIFAGILLVILFYAATFSPEKDNYPIPCIHEKITGEKCTSCGLSHSLSLVMRGRISEAYEWNNYGLRVFIFFLGQLLLRIFFSRYYLTNQDYRRHLIIADVTGSSVLFLLTFMPFITYILRWM